jgi:hypothetical protein
LTERAAVSASAYCGGQALPPIRRATFDRDFLRGHGHHSEVHLTSSISLKLPWTDPIIPAASYAAPESGWGECGAGSDSIPFDKFIQQQSSKLLPERYRYLTLSKVHSRMVQEVKRLGVPNALLHRSCTENGHSPTPLGPARTAQLRTS